jgi:hypothetical protein
VWTKGVADGYNEIIRNILAITNELKPAAVSCNTESPPTAQIFCPAARKSLRIGTKYDGGER